MKRTTMAVLCAMGCGPTVSLDDPPPPSTSGPSTGAGPFGEVSTPADELTANPPDDGAALDTGATKLDVPPDPPLPPGSCDPDCQLELTQAWVYDGPAGAPGAPLDPEDKVTVIVEPNGMITLAEERQGELELVRLSHTGQELWTMPLALPCDPCRIVELGLHPSGDLLLAGYGIDGTGTPAALAARVELGAPTLLWATLTPLVGGREIVPRAGSLVTSAIDGLLLQLVLEGSVASSMEQLEVFVYDDASGTLSAVEILSTGLGSGDAPPPRAARDAFDTLVSTHPTWAGDSRISGTVSWHGARHGVLLASTPVVRPSLHLVTAPDGRVITLGQGIANDRQVVLYVDSGRFDEPQQWSITDWLMTVTASTPALAVDDIGHVIIAARVADGRPDQERTVELEVRRRSEEGSLVWRLTLPLAFDRTNEPVALALLPYGGLVLGGFVAGARHVELREPYCDCG